MALGFRVQKGLSAVPQDGFQVDVTELTRFHDRISALADCIDRDRGSHSWAGDSALWKAFGLHPKEVDLGQNVPGFVSARMLMDRYEVAVKQFMVELPAFVRAVHAVKNRSNGTVSIYTDAQVKDMQSAQTLTRVPDNTVPPAGNQG